MGGGNKRFLSGGRTAPEPAPEEGVVS